MERKNYQFNSCIVRPVSKSIEQALRLEEPESPISIETAQKQHKKYTEILKSFVENVIEVLKSE
jgi:N-dimethylarginine dimethylaminohydrolase